MKNYLAFSYIPCFCAMSRAEDAEESEATTGELTEFIEKAKMGEITNQDIPKFAKMFKVQYHIYYCCFQSRGWTFCLSVRLFIQRTSLRS